MWEETGLQLNIERSFPIVIDHLIAMLSDSTRYPVHRAADTFGKNPLASKVEGRLTISATEAIRVDV
jgi:hypothetical protein